MVQYPSHIVQGRSIARLSEEGYLVIKRCTEFSSALSEVKLDSASSISSTGFKEAANS